MVQGTIENIAFWLDQYLTAVGALGLSLNNSQHHLF
jgi:hypothetical protein